MRTRSSLVRLAVLAVSAGAAAGTALGTGLAPADGAGAPLAQAAAVAGAQWPDSRCRGRERVIWTSQDELDAAHPGAGAAADASVRDCTVRLSERARSWSGPRTCALLQHEFGHLAGRAHSSDPMDVMYEGSVPWTVACTRAFPPRKALSPRWRCRLARAADMTLSWDCRRSGAAIGPRTSRVRAAPPR
jgi:hypothetical protein